MSVLMFVLRKTMVNYVKEIFRKKSSIFILIALAALAALLIFSNSVAPQPAQVQNLDVFGAFLVGMYLMITMMSLSQGLKRGATLFSVADVNLLFTSPVKPQHILIYGITRQTAILMLASVFMLAQSTNLKINFGVGASGLAGLMIGYTLLGIISTLLSVNVYAACASRSGLRKRVETSMRAVFAVLIVGIGYYAMTNGAGLIDALRGFMGSDLWNYVPAVGWARAVTIYASAGNWMMASVYIALLIIGCGACVLWLMKSKTDFFEDVLSAAENAQSVKEAAANGKFMTTGEVSKRAKRELPALKGSGATVFFHRIMREESRRGFWLFSLTTIAAVGGHLFGLMMNSMDVGMTPTESLWTIIMFSAYLLIFLSLTSSVNRELTQHYIYTAPSPAFAKLVAISSPQLIKYAADSVVFFAAACLITKVEIMPALLATVLYFSVGLVFTAGQLLVEKLLHNLKLKMLIMLLYIFILAVLVFPGLIVGMVMGTFGLVAAGYLVSIAWNVVVSTLIVLFCRNLLNSMK